MCYMRGRGVAIDETRAMKLIRDAADRGLIRAKTHLARRKMLRIYNPVDFV
jgi:TPR repeat protein